MDHKSLIKRILARSRKSKTRVVQASAPPPSPVESKIFGKDVSQNQLAVPERSVPRSITPIKGECALYTLHDTSHNSYTPSEGQFPIDIVAVHGLDGGAQKTWTHPNNHYWLNDSLPNEFPGARIYSFGYPADVLFSREQSEIADFARALLEEVKGERITKEHQRRPLIFVCHSMGGIVVKKAFNISVVDKERYAIVRKAVPAIVFLATPHRGSDFADFFKGIAGLINAPIIGTAYTGKIRNDLIKSLSKHSTTLSEISQDFRGHTKEIKIFSFLETMSTPPLKVKVVDDMSGRLDVNTETAIPMPGCDHRTICRFSGNDDVNYKKVLRILKEITIEATKNFMAELTAEDEPCLHSLSFQSMTSRQQDTHLSTPHAHSCTWVLSHPSFLTWLYPSSSPPSLPIISSNSSLLWIKGHPGTGKSTLMSFLFHHLTSSSSRHFNQDSITLSFFFHGNGESLQKSELGMFRSLLHQIYKQSFDARKTILGYYQQRVKESGVYGKNWEWQVSELKALFTSIVASPPPNSRKEKEIMVFIDALDESVSASGDKAAKELISYFHFLSEEVQKLEKHGRKLKICISSRHYPVISQTFGVTINIEEENTPDIAAYLSHQLQFGVENWSTENDAERTSLEEALVTKAAGVFLWAKLRTEKIIKGLNDGVYSVKDIKSMLEEESNDLFALYTGILMNDIEIRQRDKAFAMMKWVCLAKRLLSLGELRVAMACDGLIEIDVDEEEIAYEEVQGLFGDDNRMERLVMSLSGGLAVVSGGTVQLFHQSVDDFLRADGLAFLRRSITPSKTSEEDENVIGVCEDRISRSCLRYLRCGEILERVGVWIEGIQETYIFIEYATEYWAIHAGRAECLGIGQEHLVKYFASSPKLLETWITLYWAIGPRFDPRRPSPFAGLIHIASVFDLRSTAVSLLQNGVSLDDEDDINGSMPLGLAAMHGNDILVQQYIDLGARVNSEAGGPSPLQEAAFNGQVNMVKLLLKNGAKLDNDTNAKWALADASEKGNVKLVKVLLDAGMDVNIFRDHFGTALQAAASVGKLDVVTLLISRGADVNAAGGYDGSALQAAISGPEETRLSIVKYLLAKGADINSQGGEHGNPLQRAVVMGDFEIAKLLLSMGADVNAQGGKYGNALQSAAYIHRKEFIQLLLDHGADVNAQGGEYGTALQTAAACGDDETMELLLKLGADVNAKGGRYGTALQAAARFPEGGKGVHMLLEHGAKIEGQCGQYGNVLQAALSMGNEGLAKYFLSLGIDINETGGYGDNLQVAIFAGKEPFIRYLIDNGAIVNAEGGEFGSPLRAAIYWNKVLIVKLLLECGADPNAKAAGFSGTPLHQAAERGNVLSETSKRANVEIVRALLDHGADIEAQGSWCRTPIHLAIRSCHKAVVELLLARGAHLDVSEEERRVLDRLLEVE